MGHAQRGGKEKGGRGGKAMKIIEQNIGMPILFECSPTPDPGGPVAVSTSKALSGGGAAGEDDGRRAGPAAGGRRQPPAPRPGTGAGQVPAGGGLN
jgi:hypothetical protein